MGGFKHIIHTSVQTKLRCVLGTRPNKLGCGLAEIQKQSDANKGCAEHYGAVSFSCFCQADFAVTMLSTIRLRLTWDNHLKGSMSFSRHLNDNSYKKVSL